MLLVLTIRDLMSLVRLVHTYYSGSTSTPVAAHLIYVLLISPKSSIIQKFSSLTSLSMAFFLEFFIPLSMLMKVLMMVASVIEARRL